MNRHGLSMLALLLSLVGIAIALLAYFKNKKCVLCDDFTDDMLDDYFDDEDCCCEDCAPIHIHTEGFDEHTDPETSTEEE